MRHPRGGNRNSSGGKNSGARLLGSEGPGSEARGSGHGTRGNDHTSRRRADGRGERTVWERIAESQDGVISVRTALRAGMTETEIRWKLRSGRWQRPMRGVLVTHSGPITDVQMMRAAVERRGPLRRNTLITDTLSDLGDGAHSVAEILYRKIENRYGLPAARRQERIDAGGSRYHLDVWYETWRVWVEIDGGYHREVRQWWDDLARQNAGVLQDRLILRFPVHVLRTEPRLVAEQVATALRQRGWEPNL
ncbi:MULTISPECIES: hypothetical protein [Protofrankia]|uniref:hypothetical protein n=1 Tax=Protofrankia TaxID=2994361 RepID=UPI00031C1CF3|nr:MULTISPECIES: hypothetical protein [Protofrankia]